MNPTLPRLLLLLQVALLLAPCLPQAAEEAPKAPTRTLAVVPFYAPEVMWQLNAPLVEYLSRRTGEPWTLLLPASHEALDEAVCSGQVDVALLGPIPLARLNRRCGVLPFLVPLTREGTPVYHSVLLTASPEITDVAGVRGKEVAFFKGSTAAHVLPVKMLADAGLEPGDYRPLFLESQDRVMAALLAGKASAGGVKSALYRRFQKEPALRVLATSQPLPNFSFCTLPSTPPTMRKRFADALLLLAPRQRPRDARRVEGWDDELRNGFAVPPPGFLDAARTLLQTTEDQRRAAP